MPTKIAGFVLRCTDKKKTAEFYTALGLSAKEHKHAKGPFHFVVDPVASEMLVEIYDIIVPRTMDAVMLEVDSIEKALAIAKEFGIEAKRYPVINEHYRYVYITDPDNRDVMLIEQKKPEQFTG